MKSFILFFLLISLFSPLFAQSLYLQGDQFGMMGSAGYTYSEDVYSFDARIGYSPDSRFNFSTTLSRSFYEMHELKSTSIAGNISYLFFKPEKDIPFFIVANTGINYGDYDSPFITEDNASINYLDFIIGGNLIFKIRFLDLFEIFPGFGVAHIWRDLKVQGDEYSIRTNDEVNSFKTSVDLSIPLSNVSNLIISPAASFTEEHNSYSISFGFLFYD